MHVINAQNVNDAFYQAVQLFKGNRVGVPVRKTPSRNGTTLEVDGPIATVYCHPWERVLFHPQRDANPFFHLFEALWILGGRGDVAWISQFNSHIHNFSDDGVVFHGAYGERLRGRGLNQIQNVIDLLQEDPESRRAVLAMSHPGLDTLYRGKDLPCNTHAYLKIRDGALRMTVCCRSNDAMWGAYGANAVHFSILQEYIADKLSVSIGPYVQISDSLHVYTGFGAWPQLASNFIWEEDPYTEDRVHRKRVKWTRLNAWEDAWDEDLTRFLSSDLMIERDFQTTFFAYTVAPMHAAWGAYKGKNFAQAQEWVSRIKGEDWRVACQEWMNRRQYRHEQRERRNG